MDNVDVLKTIALFFLKNDVETLYMLGIRVKKCSPIITIGLMQYYSLFCSEVNSLFDKWNVKAEVINESEIKMLNERNNIKLFNERYGKIKNRILDIDSVQDDYYKKKLPFNFLKAFNCHYNIGVFVNEEKEIVGNTQFFSYIMNNPKKLSPIFDGETFNKFGYENGIVIASVKKGLSSYFEDHVPNVHVIPTPILYKDFNTNKSFASIKGVTEYNKELTLRLLHLISALGFMKNVICRFTDAENIWNTRVKYILVYHIIQSLMILANKYPNIFSWVHKDLWFMNTGFRNCMTHYDLYQKNKPIIPTDHINTVLPMFGIVEYFFKGKSYFQLTQALEYEMNYIYDNMNKMLKIDLSDAKAF